MWAQGSLESQAEPILKSTQGLCWSVAFRVWVSTSAALPIRPPKLLCRRLIGLSLSEALGFCSRLAREEGAVAKIEAVALSVSVKKPNSCWSFGIVLSSCLQLCSGLFWGQGL